MLHDNIKSINREHLNFQRKVLGVLCALLAPACLLFGLFGLSSNLPEWYESISATYYANSKICMIGLLFATAVFFLTYRGYDKKDTILAMIQGISALGVIVFPCTTPGIPSRVGLFQLPVNLSNIFHCISASTLFIAFGVMVEFLFTLSDNKILCEGKRRRNIVYRVCGIIIFVSILMLPLKSVTPIFNWVPSWFPFTWLIEFIALEAYAIAWLVKADTFDKLSDRYCNKLGKSRNQKLTEYLNSPDIKIKKSKLKNPENTFADTLEYTDYVTCTQDAIMKGQITNGVFDKNTFITDTISTLKSSCPDKFKNELVTIATDVFFRLKINVSNEVIRNYLKD